MELLDPGLVSVHRLHHLRWRKPWNENFSWPFSRRHIFLLRSDNYSVLATVGWSVTVQSISLKINAGFSTPGGKDTCCVLCLLLYGAWFRLSVDSNSFTSIYPLILSPIPEGLDVGRSSPAIDLLFVPNDPMDFIWLSSPWKSPAFPALPCMAFSPYIAFLTHAVNWSVLR